jgi:TRAP-type C4-dicarboxylate transport system permease small subunit
MNGLPDRVGPLARIYSAYARLINILAGTSMAMVVVIMAVQVVARYVFNASLIWAEELCRYILVWQTFLFIGMAYQRGELIAVDVVPLMLKPGWRLLLKLVVSVPILIFLWLMMINGYVYADRFQNQGLPAIDFIWMSIAGRTTDISVFWVYVSVAVGSALLGLHLIGSIVADAVAVLSGRTERTKDASGIVV